MFLYNGAIPVYVGVNVRQLFTIYTYVCLTNMRISLESLYLYSCIGLVFIVLLCRVQILAHSSQLIHDFISMSGSVHVFQFYNIVRPG